MTPSSNIRLLYVARGVRGIGDGFATIILPVYLIAIGYSPLAIGIIVTASLLGTALLTLVIGAIAPRHDLRTLMLLGAVLMAVTGFVFPNVRLIALLAPIAFIGTINPTSGDIGVMIPLEHTMLARGVADLERTRAFARYSLIGALSIAAGTLGAAVPDFLVRMGIERPDSFKIMFYFYGLLGLTCILLYWLMPRTRVAETGAVAPLGPSRSIVYKLAALFSLDSFAGGFVAQSLMALWLFTRFGISLSAASVFFFCSTILGALSFPIAARLARRFGLINTMVFTHVPSSLFLILAAFSSDLKVVLGLLLLRAAFSQMDVPTRTSYVMAVVTPAEQPAAASVTAVPRSLASAISPAFAGALQATAFSALPLVVCGVLKLIYDAGLLISFRHLKAPEESRGAMSSGRTAEQDAGL